MDKSQMMGESESNGINSNFLNNSSPFIRNQSIKVSSLDKYSNDHMILSKSRNAD